MREHTPRAVIQRDGGPGVATPSGSPACRVKIFKMKVDPWRRQWPDSSGYYGIQLPVSFELELDSGSERSDCLIGQTRTGQRESFKPRMSGIIPLGVRPSVDHFNGTPDAPPGQTYWWDGATTHAGNVDWRITLLGLLNEKATFEDAPGWAIVGSLASAIAWRLGRGPVHNLTRASFPIYVGGLGHTGHFQFTTFVLDARTKAVVRQLKWGMLVDYTDPATGRHYFYL